MIQWWYLLTHSVPQLIKSAMELTIVLISALPVFAGFITGLVMGWFRQSSLMGASLHDSTGVGTGELRIDATSGAVLATAFSVAQGIKPEIAISTIAVPVAGLFDLCDILGRRRLNCLCTPH